mgnify:CR=1 FL=1
MLFQYHIREMTAETSAEDFVTHFVHVEKFLSFCQQCSSCPRLFRSVNFSPNPQNASSEYKYIVSWIRQHFPSSS